MKKSDGIQLQFSIPNGSFGRLYDFFDRHGFAVMSFILTFVSIVSFAYFYTNGLGLAYNDARSHLDIGRRVVEGLKPGLAQLGSVWLPLPHFLMVPTIWNDFMWHSGLSGALESMIAFVITGLLIYEFLDHFNVGLLGKLVGAAIFILNINVLYLQSTAMTELLLLATMTAGVYELVQWQRTNSILNLVKSAFFIMLSTLIRYDGWFLLACATLLVGILTFKKYGFKVAEGTIVLFCTLAGLGVLLWFAWNQLIFGDALYFAFGPYSAHVQQQQLAQAGNLPTKHNLIYSAMVYMYAVFFNSNTFIVILGLIGTIVFLLDRKIKSGVRIATLALFAPLAFNIIALYFAYSVLFIQGISGNTWFNVRYGIMLMPAFAIFIGYLIDRAYRFRPMLIWLIGIALFFTFINFDAVTIDDARVGSSQKNVTEVSGWLRQHAANQKGFILISVASHDAIIFSSGLPMKRFIHEGTGAYWDSATTSPDRWARWIIMRSNDLNDSTFKLVHKTPGFKKYNLVGSYPFADIYELKPEFLSGLQTEAVLPKQK